MFRLHPRLRVLFTFCGLAASASPTFASVESAAKDEACCAVIELRQYTLYPYKRDVLIDLFEREFVESQEAVGINVVGHFRDLDNPNRYVWVRGFHDMEARAKALQAFYYGPVWQAHRNAANATIVDSDNVLLLRPASVRSEFSAPKSPRPPVGATEPGTSLVVATIYYRNAPIDDEFVRFFEDQVKPVLAQTGVSPLAYFQTETAENNFPKLPVRTGENIFVWFATFANQAAYDAHNRRLAQSKLWNEKVLPDLSKRLKSPPQQLRLEPAPRSQLR